MGILSGLKPERVFYYFEELCKIPHGSYNTKAISDYCVSVARSLGLEVRQDEANNVVIRKPASSGCKSNHTVMLQGHLDMVCVKDAGVDHDFEKDGLKLVVEDGFVRAQGTTLGGDDGIAVAMGLAILEDQTLVHPSLEVVFTTEEEVGMDGATVLDTSDLHADCLINLDSEEEGHFLAGCAGGVKAESRFEIKTCVREGLAVNLKIDGCVGGHSGAEIDKCRANAIILMGRLLNTIDKSIDFDLASISGGAKDNAIPIDAEALIVIDPADREALDEIIALFAADIHTEYQTSDPDIGISAQDASDGEHEVYTKHLLGRILLMLMLVPNGIQTMSAELNMPESSLNLGILDDSDGFVRMTWAVRSSVASLKGLMKDKLENLTQLLGGEISFNGDYPAWPFNPNGKICGMCKEIYERQTGRSSSIETMHAGLECGLLSEKMPGLDIVSMGPDLFDIHTSKEKMKIDSVERIWNLVKEVLKELAVNPD